jgi:hypothetical protein
MKSLKLRFYEKFFETEFPGRTIAFSKKVKNVEWFYKTFCKAWEGVCSIVGMERKEAIKEINNKISDYEGAIATYKKAGF